MTLEQGRQPTAELKEELRKWVAKEIGALAKPDDIRFTDTLPKDAQREDHAAVCCASWLRTANVKGDTTTLEDFGVIAKLQEQDEV